MSPDRTTSADAMRWLCDELVDEFSRTGHFSIVQEFLEGLHGFDRKILLGSVFWAALRTGDFNLAANCLDAGYPIAPNEQADSGPLHCTMSLLGNRPDVIGWFLRHGAEAERRDVSNVTPLIAAVHGGFEEIVATLLQAGADVNASTMIDDDETALMAAAAFGNQAIVTMLLAAGADTSRSNRWGRDAAQLAESSGNDDVAQLIRSATPSL